MNTFQVPPEENNSRLDRCIRRSLGDVSQSLLEKYLRQKLILVNNVRAKAFQKVKSGQLIYYSKSIFFNNSNKNKNKFNDYEKAFYKKLFSNIVVKETDGWIVLNKPNGIAVQGGSKQKYHIDDFLKVNYQNVSQKPRLVHRLDKDTSGLLLIAKTQIVARKFAKLFKEGRVIKIYFALVSPSPKTKSGIIKSKIKQINTSISNKMYISEKDGKNSITKFKVLEKINDNLTLVALYPVTGRTHQLRLHMQYFGSPILGDKKYFNKFKERIEIEKNNSLKLHSGILKIPNEKVMTAEFPKHFKDTLEKYGIKLMKADKILKLFFREEIEKKK